MPFPDYDEPVFRPPSEADSLIVQLTLGCSHNRCVFCPMYKSKRFRLRPVTDIARELAALPSRFREQTRRVFIADGDALTAPMGHLVELLDLLAVALPALTRVGIYASPASLRGKTVAELALLRDKRLRILYFGLESGDDATLASMRKGATAAEMLTLCDQAQAAGLKLSVTAILGLGGQQRSRQHAEATGAWVSQLSPAYFSLLTLIPSPELAALAGFTPLTNGGVLEEIALLLPTLQPQRTILRSNHGSNLLQLAGNLPRDRERLIAECAQALTAARRHPDWYHRCSTETVRGL